MVVIRSSLHDRKEICKPFVSHRGREYAEIPHYVFSTVAEIEDDAKRRVQGIPRASSAEVHRARSGAQHHFVPEIVFRMDGK